MYKNYLYTKIYKYELLLLMVMEVTYITIILLEEHTILRCNAIYGEINIILCFYLIGRKLKSIFLLLHNFVLLNQMLYNLGILLQKRDHSHICKKHHIAVRTCNSHLISLCKKAALQQSCTLSESQRDGHICHCMESFERSILHLLNSTLCRSFDCYCKLCTQTNIH